MEVSEVTIPGMSMGSSSFDSFDHGMGAASTCKTSEMLWNWNTVDVCIFSSKWHIKSVPQFAASCIAVALLAMSLSLLRRLTHEYDRHILKEHKRRTKGTQPQHCNNASSPDSCQRSLREKALGLLVSSQDPTKFRPHLLQQVVRGVLHLSQFVVASFAMLIFMLLNGYLIFSILVGVFLGYVLFEWESVECP
jgi:copper transporter 1